MRQILSLISAALICLISGGCGHSDRALRQQLSLADSLMSIRPDSALAILNRLPADSLRGERKPWYALLTTKALDKNHQDILDDSLINIAVAHYSGRGDSLEYQSLYYKGVCLYQADHIDQALIYLHEAFEKSEAASDPFYQAMSARELSFLYSDMKVINKELEWIEVAVSLFKKGNKPLYAVWAETDMIDALAKNGHVEKAAELCNQLENSEYMNNPGFHHKLLRNKAMLYHGLDSSEMVLDVFDRLIDDGYNMRPHDHLVMAASYIDLGKVSEAQKSISNSRADMKYPADSMYMYRLLARIDAILSDYKVAYQHSDSLINQLLESDLDLLTNPKTTLLADTYKLEAEKKSLQLKYDRLIMLLLFIGIFLVGVVIYTLLGRRLYRQRVENDKNLAELSTLREDLKFSHNVIADKLTEYKTLEAEHASLQSHIHGSEEQFKSELKRVFSSQINMLDEMFGLLFRNIENISDKRLYKDALSTIHRLNDKSVINELERIIDLYSDNWMSKFRKAYPDLNQGDYLLSLYLFIGFRSDSIAVLMDKKTTKAVHTAKHKLKLKLMKNEIYTDLNVLAELNMGDSR